MKTSRKLPFNSVTKNTLVLALGLALAYPVSAEVIQVAPGNNTLSVAVENANSGDTLVLAAGGVYTESEVLDIRKALTIKGASNTNKAILSDIDMRVFNPENAEQSITFQSLHFAEGRINSAKTNDFDTYWQNVAFLQNHFVDSDLTFGSYNYDIESAYFVGNTWNVTGNITQRNFDFEVSGTLHFAGNKVLASSLNYRNTLAASKCNTMGNEFRLDTYNSQHSLEIACDISLFYGNKTTVLSDDSGEYRVTVFNFSKGIHNIYNNLFNISSDFKFPYENNPQYHYINMLEFENGGEYGVTLSNNVFDYTNHPDSFVANEEDEFPAVIKADRDITMHGNIFYHVADYDVYSSSSTTTDTSNKSYNLCHQTYSCVNGTNTLTTDPKFIDLNEYKLAADSPALNASNPASKYNDVDGSRGDMGVYGGSFPFDAYQSQLEESSKPFIYPLFQADSHLGSGNLLFVDVLAVARAQ